MNKQEIFDTVVAHLRKQGKKAQHTTDDGVTTCRYRTDDGLKCAAGCLMPDEVYSSDMEGQRCFASDLLARLPRALVDVFESDVLHELQNLHDHDPVSMWETRFAEIAEIYELEYRQP